MRAVILVNPNAGTGRAVRIGGAIDHALRSAGHERTLRTISLDPTLGAGDLAGADALIVVGGDGTVHHAAQLAIDSGVPLYHAASGNENLFAREFAMRPDPESVVNALEQGRGRLADLARCNGVSFLLMCSVGPDASVIRRMTRARRRPTGHLAYTLPVIAEAFRPYIPRLSVHVDGEPLVEARRGLVVVANCRQYAMRVDPCQSASMFDNRLDVVFLPCATSLGAVRRLIQCRARAQARSGAIAVGAGESIRIQIEGADPICQLDGEAPRRNSPADGAPALTCEVSQGVLPVLVPPGQV